MMSSLRSVCVPLALAHEAPIASYPAALRALFVMKMMKYRRAHRRLRCSLHVGQYHLPWRRGSKCDGRARASDPPGDALPLRFALAARGVSSRCAPSASSPS